jgi:hypothetical protein
MILPSSKTAVVVAWLLRTAADSPHSRFLDNAPMLITEYSTDIGTFLPPITLYRSR